MWGVSVFCGKACKLLTGGRINSNAQAEFVGVSSTTIKIHQNHYGVK